MLEGTSSTSTASINNIHDTLFNNIYDLYSAGWDPKNYVTKNQAVLNLIKYQMPPAQFFCTRRNTKVPDFFPFNHFYSPLEHLIFAAVGFQPGGVKGTYDLRPYPLIYVLKNLTFSPEEVLHAKDTLQMALTRIMPSDFQFSTTFINHYEKYANEDFAKISPGYTPKMLIAEVETMIQGLNAQVQQYLALNLNSATVIANPSNALIPQFNHQKRGRSHSISEQQTISAEEDLALRPAKMNKSSLSEPSSPTASSSNGYSFP